MRNIPKASIGLPARSGIGEKIAKAIRPLPVASDTLISAKFRNFFSRLGGGGSLRAYGNHNR